MLGMTEPLNHRTTLAGCCAWRVSVVGLGVGVVGWSCGALLYDMVSHSCAVFAVPLWTRAGVFPAHTWRWGGAVNRYTVDRLPWASYMLRWAAHPIELCCYMQSM